ncbi:MAG: hemerythrin domain-containing protein [Rhodospirillaceae bacterium]|nr:hemerythrin domain-containing protein [Rhodospirillaceae bacterium]
MTAHSHAFPIVPNYQPRKLAASAPSPDFIAGMAANDLAPQRREIYHLVHKGLRAAMSDALARLGRVDLDAPDATLDAVADLLQLCAEHLAHENAFLHTAMERVVPGSAQRCAEDHLHHEKSIRELEARLKAARETPMPARERALKVLYRLLAAFVAENFQHMEIEESTNTALLWAHYTDQDLLAIEQQIHAHIKPERMLTWLRWILPSVTRQQRATMMRGMQAGMPPELFGAILDMVKPHLSDLERTALVADLA